MPKGMEPRHSHLMDGTWDGQTPERIAELHPQCVACKSGQAAKQHG